jgi:hypothetical protein
MIDFSWAVTKMVSADEAEREESAKLASDAAIMDYLKSAVARGADESGGTIRRRNRKAQVSNRSIT